MIEAGKGEERTFLLRYWTTSSSSVGWNRNPGGNLRTPFFTSLTALSMDPNRGERRKTKKKKRVRCRKRETWMVCFYKVEDDTNNSFSLLLLFLIYIFGVNHTQSPSFFWRHFHKSNFFFFNHLLFFFVSQLLFLVGIYLLSLSFYFIFVCFICKV